MSITRVSAPNQRAPRDLAVASSPVVGCIFYSDRGQSRIEFMAIQRMSRRENVKDVSVDVKGGGARSGRRACRPRRATDPRRRKRPDVGLRAAGRGV